MATIYKLKQDLGFNSLNACSRTKSVNSRDYRRVGKFNTNNVQDLDALSMQYRCTWGDVIEIGGTYYMQEPCGFVAVNWR